MQSHVYHGIAGQPLASAIFGTYTALVYGTPIIGGIIADKWLGRNATLIVGGVLMAIGHFLMAVEPASCSRSSRSCSASARSRAISRPRSARLYGPSDLRRAMAFQIFYIFINVSVIMAPLISGTLGQKVGLALRLRLRRRRDGARAVHLPVRPPIPAGRGSLPRPSDEPALREPLTREDWMRVVYLVILIPVLAMSLLTNQEIFNAYLVWGDQHFDLTLRSTIPSSWLITVDATVSFAMLVAVAAFWKWWGTRRREPDEISKMIIGSVFTVVGGLCLFMAALTQPAGGKISLFWPMMFELITASALLTCCRSAWRSSRKSRRSRSPRP